MQVCTSLQTDNHASTPPLFFYRPDVLPATQPTVSKHWRQYIHNKQNHSLTFATAVRLHRPHTHTRLMALFPGLPGWAGTRKVKPVWVLLKQETASGSGISWAICKSAPRSREITTPAPHHSSFYRPDALPAAQPTASKHWRQVDSLDHRYQNCCTHRQRYGWLTDNFVFIRSLVNTKID